MSTLHQQLVPGTVVKFRSARYAHLVYHWGVIDYPNPWTGDLRVVHCDKGKVVATTSLAEFFPEGGQLEVVRVPVDVSEGRRILDRMHSLDGQPYDIFVRNCEQVVNWALTGESVSGQLRFAAVVVGLSLAAFVLARNAQA